MKKCFKSIFFVTIFVLSCITIQAATEKAKLPTTIPAENTSLYADVYDEFDFSKITFDGENGNAIVGKDNMKKIRLADGYDAATLTLNNDWFTAYCLDGNLKYPENGLHYQLIANPASTYKQQLDTIVTAAIFNDTSKNQTMYNAFKTFENGVIASQASYQATDGTTIDESLAQTYVESILNGQTISVKLIEFIYLNTEGSQITIDASEFLSYTNSSDTEYILEIEKNDVIFDKYLVTGMPFHNKTYNHGLWIIEHSYPTLTIEDTLIAAGADITMLEEEIRTLHSGEVLNLETLTDYVESYVYSTIQYAIWKVHDGIEVDGEKLGNSLQGSVELNKLYQYLIRDREEYANYSSKIYGDKISLVKPSGNEVFKENSTNYIYGPYKFEHNVMELSSISLSFSPESNTTGIKIVDENGTEITNISNEESFYVAVDKETKTANVKIDATVNGAKGFYPNESRGRIYYANYALGQNVISGGRLIPLTIEDTFEFSFNPKTGVDDIGILFLVTLIAFSLGYLVLSYKNQPVEL